MRVTHLPSNVISVEAEETHCTCVAAITVRVCVYCVMSGSSNTVSVLSVTVVVESLVQVTVVAGPPLKIQVSVNWGLPTLRSDVGSRIDVVI